MKTLTKLFSRKVTPVTEKKGQAMLEGSVQTVAKTIDERVTSISKEFKEAFEFIQKYQRTVTFFGSTRMAEGNPFYDRTRALAGRISTELGYTVVTGGGPGIMEAANRGASEVGGESVGLTIRLPFEQGANSYLTSQHNFSHFYSRKVTLAFFAETYIFCPGGFGTLDELFEILTLIQTNKMARVPVILYGSEFWGPVDILIKEHLLKHGTISAQDTKLYHITDNDDDVMELIRMVPVR
jgi:uncharacterized protein (TIGR00730 family)